MTDVLNAMAFGPPRRQRPHWVCAIERLHRVFSSTQNTAACCGGCRDRPTRSGSLEARYPSSRWGLRACLAQMRVTVMWERPPNAAASLREDQCVDPSRRGVVRRPGQDACFEPIGHGVERPPGVAGEQPRQPIRGKALAPATDGPVVAVQLGANLGPRQAIGHAAESDGRAEPNRLDRDWLSLGAEVPCVHSWSVSSRPPSASGYYLFNRYSPLVAFVAAFVTGLSPSSGAHPATSTRIANPARCCFKKYESAMVFPSSHRDGFRAFY